MNRSIGSFLCARKNIHEFCATLTFYVSRDGRQVSLIVAFVSFAFCDWFLCVSCCPSPCSSPTHTLFYLSRANGRISHRIRHHQHNIGRNDSMNGMCTYELEINESLLSLERTTTTTKWSTDKTCGRWNTKNVAAKTNQLSKNAAWGSVR